MFLEGVEYRPPTLNLSGLQCTNVDLLALPFPNESIESLYPVCMSSNTSG